MNRYLTVVLNRYVIELDWPHAPTPLGGEIEFVRAESRRTKGKTRDWSVRRTNQIAREPYAGGKRVGEEV